MAPDADGAHQRDLGLLTVAVLAASSAPPLMAVIAAPALSIAFWRNAMALPVAVPLALWRDRADVRRLRPRVLALILLAATMLGTHFASLASSLDRTSIASAATLVCSQSIWAALFAAVLGERLTTVAWVGTLIAFGGVVLVTGADAALTSGSTVGNVLALVAGAAGGAYIVTGGVVRRSIGTSLYTSLCYACCAALLAVAVLVADEPFTGFPPSAWVQLAALTVLAQLLGHSLFNLVLRSVGASFVSLAQLMTVPTAMLIAAVVLGEPPSPWILPGAATMLVGIAMVLATRRGPRSSGAASRGSRTRAGSAAGA